MRTIERIYIVYGVETKENPNEEKAIVLSVCTSLATAKEEEETFEEADKEYPPKNKWYYYIAKDILINEIPTSWEPTEEEVEESARKIMPEF